MVDHLVSHRRDDIPGVRTASSPGAVRTTMDRDSRCSFLVGAATQFFPSDSRLALRGMAFPGIFPGATVFLLVYSWTRRLPPLIAAHWLMDILAALITVGFQRAGASPRTRRIDQTSV